MHFQNSFEPNKTHGALLLTTVRKHFNTVPPVIIHSKFSSETSSGNEERGVKASLVDGGFSEHNLRATLWGESQLEAC